MGAIIVSTIAYTFSLGFFPYQLFPKYPPLKFTPKLSQDHFFYCGIFGGIVKFRL